MTNKKLFSKHLLQKNKTNQKIIYSLDFRHRNQDIIESSNSNCISSSICGFRKLLKIYSHGDDKEV